MKIQTWTIKADGIGGLNMECIGKRENAIKTKKTGGKAFPRDYNWTCPICNNESRAFEPTCNECKRKAEGGK